MTTILKNNPPLLGDLLRAFFHWLVEGKNVSSHTIAAYRDTLVQFLRHLADTTNRSVDTLKFEDSMADHVMHFLHHIEHDRRVSITTRNHRLSVLKSFCKFAAYENPLLAFACSRVTQIPVKRHSETLLEYLEPEEMEAIIASADRSKPEGRRNYVILLMLFNTGCRVSELTQLTSDNIRLEPPRHVRILGKGRRWRTVPLWERTTIALEETIRDRQGESPFLFIGQRGNPLTRFGVRHLLERHCRLAAETVLSLRKKKVTPHTIRHTTAIALLRATGDIDAVSKILGHASLNTTRLYTAADRTRLAETLETISSILMPNSHKSISQFHYAHPACRRSCHPCHTACIRCIHP